MQHKHIISLCAGLGLLGLMTSAMADNTADNESLFDKIVPDNASVSALKESGGHTLDAGEEVLGNIVEDSKSFGSFLLKKAGELVNGTKDTISNLTE